MEIFSIVLIAIGGTLFFEGLIWAILPGPTRKMYIGTLEQLDDRSLHLGGLLSVAAGIIVIGLTVT